MKKGFLIAILICAIVAAVGLFVVSSRNSTDDFNETTGGSAIAQESENSKKESVSTFSNTESNDKDVIPVSGEKAAEQQAGKAVEQTLTESEAQQINTKKQAEIQTVVDVTAEELAASADSFLTGGLLFSDEEFEEIELPPETDVPEDWNWKDLPEPQTKGQEETTEGPENASIEEGKPEAQSNEESTEESSTEETETEKPTLSPEEKASIAESAKSPLEFPPVIF